MNRPLFALLFALLLAAPATGGPEPTAPTAGLRRSIEVGTVAAVTPRGAADRALFAIYAEVQVGGEVGVEGEPQR